MDQLIDEWTDRWMDRWTDNVMDIYTFCCPLGVSGPDSTVTCTDSQMETVLNRSLVLTHYPTADDVMADNDVGMVSVRKRVCLRVCVICYTGVLLRYLVIFQTLLMTISFI